MEHQVKPAANDPIVSLLARWFDAGDREALDQLVREIEPWLHAEIRRSLDKGGSRGDESMDLLQTVVMNFLAWGPKYRPVSGTQFRALLKRIATNEIIDQRRRAENNGTSHLESLSPASQSLASYGLPARSNSSPSMNLVRNEDAAWVKLAMQFLDDDERFLLIASEVDGQSWAQIAKQLGLASPDAARVRATRLKPRMANLLRQLRSGRTPHETNGVPAPHATSPQT